CLRAPRRPPSSTLFPYTTLFRSSRVAVFIDEPHCPRLSGDVRFRERFELVGVPLPETAQEFERGRRLPFVDLGHGEADVHEHPVTGTYAVPVDQPDVDDPADARDLDLGQVGLSGDEFDDLAGNAQAHRLPRSFHIRRMVM